MNKQVPHQDCQVFATHDILQGPTVKCGEEDQPSLTRIPDYLDGTCIVIYLSVVLGVFLQTRHPKGFSQFDKES